MIRFLSLAFILSLVAPVGAARIVDMLPDDSRVIDGYSMKEVRQRFDEGDIHDIEGIWRFVDDGSVMAIERFVPDEIPDNGNASYRIIVVKSPTRALSPGTLMGYVSPTAKKGVYDASVYTAYDGLRGLHKKRRFCLSLGDDGLLSFTQYRQGVKLNLWRLIPYMFRYSIRYSSDRPKGLDGCVRIWPPSVSVPFEPRYL